VAWLGGAEGEVWANDGPGFGECAYAYAMPNTTPTVSRIENTPALSVRRMERSTPSPLRYTSPTLSLLLKPNEPGAQRREPVRKI
jgi:hypothetical protein